MNARLIFSISLLMATLQSAVVANGVVVGDATRGVYARLQWSRVQVDVKGQVSATTTTQQFANVTGTLLTVGYAFPMPLGASATRLRWKEGATWYQASFVAHPQDSTLPGSGTSMAPGLKSYLGAKPLFFSFPRKLPPDSLLTVELTYVELLPYKYGTVSYQYPNNYSLIQTTALQTQTLLFSLTSQRTIQSINLQTPAGGTSSNSGNEATLAFERNSAAADTNYVVSFSLLSTDLGLFSYSTKPTDSLGYFTFVVEPNSWGTDIIKKNFAVIIDRSGSMSGTKMTQAKNAASYVVNNLNEGDSFTLVDFDDQINTFREGLVTFTASSRDSALAYINGLTARNNTDIGGAFHRTIPFFSTVSDTAANLIIFLTDGQATAGQLSSDSILAIVTREVQFTHKTIYIFTFGIGSDVNQQLLTLIAAQNKGIAEFLGNDQLESRITDFYNTIRHPVIIGPHISFSSPVVSEPYPDPLPNLYKGQQLLVSGIYTSAQPVTVTFSGTSFGRPVSYQYQLPLADTLVEENSFLPKLWAKLKIEFLLVRYYSAPIGSALANEIKKEIIDLSIRYGVVSPFTSLSGGTGTAVEERGSRPVTTIPSAYRILGNYPNPFNAGTSIVFRVEKPIHQLVTVRIYNSAGQLVTVLTVMVRGAGEYRVRWSGLSLNSTPLASGVYFYVIDFGDAMLGARMAFIK